MMWMVHVDSAMISSSAGDYSLTALHRGSANGWRFPSKAAGPWIGVHFLHFTNCNSHARCFHIVWFTKWSGTGFAKPETALTAGYGGSGQECRNPTGGKTMILQEELEKIPFLRNLGERHIAHVATLAQLQECPEGAVVFREGQDSSNIYFVLSGQISLGVKEGNKDCVEVYIANPGELLGWSPVLGRHSMTATARAKTRSRL